MVERLIRNFYVAGYAINSTVGYRVVPSVHSASRALIESDFESNFRVARRAAPNKAANSNSAEVDLVRKASACFGYSESICLLSRSDLTPYVAEGAKRLGAVQLTRQLVGLALVSSNCGFTDVIENMERESGLRTLASSLGIWPSIVNK